VVIRAGSGQFLTNPHLARLASDGALGIGLSSGAGGSGGTLADLFEAVAQTARWSLAAGRIHAVQRHFAEVLLAGENIGLAEYRLPYILDGSVSGACAATWPERPLPPLTFRPARSGAFLSGALHPTPNVGESWYLVTTLLQLHAAGPPSLVLLCSEQDGLHRAAHDLAGVSGDDSARLVATGVFLRGDEVLHEEATQISPYLQRFALFLQSAISTGILRRTFEGMATGHRADLEARVMARVDAVLRSVASARRLPEGPELWTACAWLRRHAAGLLSAGGSDPLRRERPG